MKLSLDTISIATSLTLYDLLELLPACGYDGVEFRCERGQAHGVEPEIVPPERRRIRTLLSSAGLEAACLSTSQHYHSPDPVEREQAIARTKQFIDLAADLECGRIRVFGGRFPEGPSKEEVIQYVGQSLRACGQYAEGKGVDVLLEMHGDFNYWEYCLGAIQAAHHPNVALNYNSDLRDLVDGSLSFTLNQVKDHIRHVHLHGLEDRTFPYKELFAFLKQMGYGGFCSLEVEEGEEGARKLIALYAALYREMVSAA
jgi:sugar phosphate isomerase/epimerase